MSFFKKITQFGLPGLFRSARRTFGNQNQPPFQPGPDPASQGLPYLNEIPGAVHPYYQPYIQSGQQAESATNPIYERMASNPNAFMEELMQGYTPSKGYRFKQQEMERAMRNTAAHGGFLGTPYDQKQQAELVQGLLSQDMQDFIKNLMGAQQLGLGGQEARVDRGFRAGTGYGNILGEALGAKAGLGYQGQAARNQMASDMYSQRSANDIARRNARMQFLGNILGLGTAAMTGGFGGFGG